MLNNAPDLVTYMVWELDASNRLHCKDHAIPYSKELLLEDLMSGAYQPDMICGIYELRPIENQMVNVTENMFSEAGIPSFVRKSTDIFKGGKEDEYDF